MSPLICLLTCITATQHRVPMKFRVNSPIRYSRNTVKLHVFRHSDSAESENIIATGKWTPTPLKFDTHLIHAITSSADIRVAFFIP